MKEKHQAVLNELLREEANRYCADCLAKGPRWASWNLGVFLCIRCAGIHRNLGVHISRVKSVNLDSWTPEQLESIQKWGNKRAAEYYECYLPQDFVRPHGDSAMETLIRNKYERKLYIKKNGEPPAKKDTPVSKPAQEKRKEKPVESKPASKKISAPVSRPEQKAAQPQKSSAVPRPHANNNVVPPKESPIIDLLGMDNPAPQQTVATQNASNDFDLFMQAPSFDAPSQSQASLSSQGHLSAPQQTTLKHSHSAPLLLEEEQSAAPVDTKASIMSLYQSGNQQKTMFGIPGGVYVTPQTGMNPRMMGALPQQHQQQMQMNQSGYRMNQPMMTMNQQVMNQNQFMKPQMMSMQNQMQNLNLSPVSQMPGMNQPVGNMAPGSRHQFMGSNNFQTNLGQAIMANSYGGHRPMMASQQPILANGPAGFSNVNAAVTPGMGHTLSNQLWQ